MAVYATKSLLYWHMPKTGGLWVTRVLARLLHADRINGILRHEDIRKLDTTLRQGRQVFGTHRDAWSWYTSLYQHASFDPTSRERLKTWCRGEPSFKSFVYGATHPSEVPLDQKLPRHP